MATRSFVAALCCAAAFLALSPALPGASSELRAQVCPITDPECMSQLPTPGVWIEPEAASFSGAAASLQVVVTITWCEPSGTLNAGSRLIKLDGVTVTGTFSYTGTAIDGCNDAAVSTGTITLTPGSHSLTASIANYVPRTGSDSRFYSYTQNAPTTTVAVTPDASTGLRGLSRKETERFTVKNTGGAPATFRFGATCTGTAATGCSATHTSALLPAGGTMLVGVNYTTGAANATGTVSLTAWKNDDSAGVRDAGSYNVTVQAAEAPGAAGDPGVTTAVDRAACLTLPAALDAVYECGDLRIAHALPVTRVLNKSLTPTLLYNSQHAYPYPVVGATVYSPGPTVPTTVTATVTFNREMVRTVTFPGWVNASNRVAVGIDASGLATGFYVYTFVVKANFLGSSSTTLYSGSGTMAIVNRSQSRFGRGWWMAGVEELKVSGSPAGSLMWIGGDGSTLRYGPAGTNRWTPEPFAGTDTIVRLTDATKGYARLITGGDSVVFDSLGRHLRTANRMGHRTEFEWTGDALMRVRLPKAAAFDPGASYRFEYLNPYGMLSAVRAPGLPSDRIVTFTNTDGRVTAISGPDTTSVTFAYADATPRITARRDRRQVWSHFGYDAGSRLSSALVTTGPGANDYVPVYYVAQESRGIAATPADQVYTVFNGPRPDSDAADYTYFWVDRRGAPHQVSDAAGNVTRSYAEDPRWPGIVTRVRYPNGREVTAAVDDAGRLTGTTDWSTSLGGRYATTLYEWDARCGEPARTTQPEGEVTSTQYNAQCLPEWSQAGQDTATRTRVAYWPANDLRAPGLVRSVTPPLSPAERYEYDTRGNLSAVVTAMDFRSEFLNDLLGRVLRTKTPVDSAQTIFRFDTTYYDTRDRAYRTESYGGGQRLTAVTAFDQEGLTRSVSRWSTPDTAKIGTTVTAWEYDALRHRVVEIAPDGQRDSTGYDFAGNATRMKSRRQHVITAEYDALNRLKKRIVPEVVYRDTLAGGFQFPRYPTCQTVRLCIAADTATYGYDEMGNLTWANNRDAEVKRSYDPAGRIATDSLRIRTWAEVAAGGNFTQHAYGLRLRYDLNGRRTALVYPRQLGARFSAQPTVVHDSVAYGYDALGRLSRMRDVVGNEFGYTYDLQGRLEKTLYPRGHFRQNSYDWDGRVRKVREDTTATGGTADEFTFRHDARGKAITQTPLATVSSYGPDTNTFSVLGPLTGRDQQRPYRNAIGPRTDYQRWTPDALGNVPVASSSFSYRYFTGTGPTNVYGTTGTWTTFQAATGRVLAVRTANGINEQLDDPAVCNIFQNDTTQRTNRFDAAGNLEFTAATFKQKLEGRCPTDVLQRDTAAVYGASYYGADQRLRVVDTRTHHNAPDDIGTDPPVYEEHRYDALGRRVLRRARHTPADGNDTQGPRDLIQRYVWDDDHLAAEIQVAGGNAVTAAALEQDTVTPTSNAAFFGRVLYLAGDGIDQPLSAVRIGYGKTVGGSYRTWEPIAITPHWDQQGQAYADVVYGPTPRCQTVAGSTDCLRVDWPARLAYGLYAATGLWPQHAYGGWFGSLLHDQLDNSGEHYRRNRYYDPASGRFTQEDPIGIEGGLNVYGFANGDPVTYSDPYGLSAECGICARLIAAGLVRAGIIRGAVIVTASGARLLHGGLRAHERLGGHTMALHVNTTVSGLAQRLATSAIPSASKFTNLRVADGAVAGAIQRNAANVQAWLSGPGTDRLAWSHSVGQKIGEVLHRGANSTVASNTVRVVLEKSASSPTGYIVYTAYPQ